VTLAASAGAAIVAAACSYPTRVFISADASDEGDAESVSDVTSTVHEASTEDAPADAPTVPTDGPQPHCVGSSSGEYDFTSTLIGCRDVMRADAAVGGTAWADRASLCGVGCRVCNAADWVNYQIPPVVDAGAHDGGDAGDAGAAKPAPVQPPFNVWLDDNLLPSGAASYACAAEPVDSGISLTLCDGHPMRVCVSNPAANAVAHDPTGDSCSLHDCGFGTQTPNLYFGGCIPQSDEFAGTLCCCGQ
jgi:hypothetical protein